MSQNEMTVSEIKNAIYSRLSPAGAEYWSGMASDGINESVIEAQRAGIDAAVATVEELAKPESDAE